MCPSIKNKQVVFLLTVFGHLPFISLFASKLLRDNDLLFPRKIFFDIYHLGFFYPNINSEQWQIIPNNILNINTFRVSLSKHL